MPADSAKTALRVEEGRGASRGSPHAEGQQVDGVGGVLPTMSSWRPAGLMALFMLTRAVHPLMIRRSQVGNEYDHERLSVPLVECVVTLVVATAISVSTDGAGRWRYLWGLREVAAFAGIGFLYAFGDYFELEMATLRGPVYQVLIQSKLLVTAGMVYCIKGQRLSALQWILLVLLVISLCCYKIMRDMLREHRLMKDTPGWSSPPLDYSPGGILLALLKVAVSCLCAVLADKCMKDCRDVPIYMQMVQLKIGWLLGIVTLMVFEGRSSLDDLFHGWRPPVLGALLSFVIKSWSTLYLLAILDALMKNIGEALALCVAYFALVFDSNFDDVIENETLITVLIVGLVAAAFLTTKRAKYGPPPAASGATAGPLPK